MIRWVCQLRPPLWENDHLQFIRLLSELKTAGLTATQTANLKKSMDISSEELTELFDRAEEEFEHWKETLK